MYYVLCLFIDAAKSPIKYADLPLSLRFADKIFCFLSGIWSRELFPRNAFADNVLHHNHQWFMTPCLQTSLCMSFYQSSKHKACTLLRIHIKDKSRSTPKALSLTHANEQGIIQEKQHGRLEIKGRQTIWSTIWLDKHKNEITLNPPLIDNAKCIRVYFKLNHARQQPRPQTQVNRASRMRKLSSPTNVPWCTSWNSTTPRYRTTTSQNLLTIPLEEGRHREEKDYWCFYH